MRYSQLARTPYEYRPLDVRTYAQPNLDVFEKIGSQYVQNVNKIESDLDQQESFLKNAPVLPQQKEHLDNLVKKYSQQFEALHNDGEINLGEKFKKLRKITYDLQGDRTLNLLKNNYEAYKKLDEVAAKLASEHGAEGIIDWRQYFKGTTENGEPASFDAGQYGVEKKLNKEFLDYVDKIFEPLKPSGRTVERPVQDPLTGVWGSKKVTSNILSEGVIRQHALNNQNQILESNAGKQAMRAYVAKGATPAQARAQIMQDAFGIGLAKRESHTSDELSGFSSELNERNRKKQENETLNFTRKGSIPITPYAKGTTSKGEETYHGKVSYVNGTPVYKLDDKYKEDPELLKKEAGLNTALARANQQSRLLKEGIKELDKKIANFETLPESEKKKGIAIITKLKEKREDYNQIYKSISPINILKAAHQQTYPTETSYQYDPKEILSSLAVNPDGPILAGNRLEVTTPSQFLEPEDYKKYQELIQSKDFTSNENFAVGNEIVLPATDANGNSIVQKYIAVRVKTNKEDNGKVFFVSKPSPANDKNETAKYGNLEIAKSAYVNEMIRSQDVLPKRFEIVENGNRYVVVLAGQYIPQSDGSVLPLPRVISKTPLTNRGY
jgi:hypothetical protein